MTKKVIVSRDVTFVEDEEWQWNASAKIDLKKRFIYVLNDDMEDGVTLEAPAVQPEAAVQPEVVIQPEVATPIATMMERPIRQQRQPVHLQDCTGTGRGWDPPGCPKPSQPDRETEGPRPLEIWPRDRETERSRPLETWPSDRKAKAFGDLAERPRP